ncbi:MAG: restriction endonuclease subunit S [Spirochaetia bacterium]|jgi:type I restriction enzyme S subunit
MKESGVEWIGEIPDHWKTAKIRRLTLVKRGASPRPIDDPKYFDDDGEYSWVRISDVSASKKYLETTEQRLSLLGKSLSVALEPRAVFLSIAGSVGKPIIAKIKCCIHDGFVYFPQYRDNSEFLFYVLSSGAPFGGLGKLGTQLNLNTDIVGDIPIPLPPLQEQERIVSFLDGETARIDELISKKQRQIELLEEKRTAIITRAVTKGLNPNAKMKDSGVAWIGEIPERWEMAELRRRWNVIDCKHQTAEYIDEGYPVISTTEVKPGRLSLETKRRTTEVFYRSLTDGGRRPHSGDIIYSRNASLGVASYVETEEPFCMGQDVCLIKSEQENQLFLTYYLNSPVTQHQIQTDSIGSTFSRINVEQIRKLMICCPPATEQQALADFFDGETSRIEYLIGRIAESIKVLLEYRSSLITAAVSGQIDVPTMKNGTDQ